MIIFHTSNIDTGQHANPTKIGHNRFITLWICAGLRGLVTLTVLVYCAFLIMFMGVKLRKTGTRQKKSWRKYEKTGNRYLRRETG